MSRYANSNPESWDYTNPAPPLRPPRKATAKEWAEARERAAKSRGERSYRADTIEPTEMAGDLTSAIVGAAGAKECAVCGTLTFGVAHGDAMCGECQETMAAES